MPINYSAVVRELEQEISNLERAKQALEPFAKGFNHSRGNVVSFKVKRHHLSASAKKRISLVQKARWAKWRKAQKKAA